MGLRWLDPILNPLACLPPPPESIKDESAAVLLSRLEALLQHQFKVALTGEKRSLLRGQGLDFSDLREYTPGDDIRKMDWNVFARTLMPHIREYREEKQLTLWLVLDCTASMHFGKANTKLQHAIELAGFFALLAERSGHRLGAFLIQSKPEIIAPKSGYGQIQHILDRMQKAAQKESVISEADPLPSAFQQLVHLIQKQATVIVLSDFLSFNPQWHLPLGQLSRQSQMIFGLMQDSVEKALPENLGLLPLRDSETDQIVWVDTNNPAVLTEYQKIAQQQMQVIVAQLQSIGMVIQANTDNTVTDSFMQLLQHPQARRRLP